MQRCKYAELYFEKLQLFVLTTLFNVDLKIYVYNLFVRISLAKQKLHAIKRVEPAELFQHGFILIFHRLREYFHPSPCLTLLHSYAVIYIIARTVKRILFRRLICNNHVDSVLELSRFSPSIPIHVERCTEALVR